MKWLGLFQIFPLDRMLVHRRSLPSNLLGFPNNSLVPIYTPGRREVPCEFSVLPKNTTQCSWQGLEPRLLNLVEKLLQNYFMVCGIYCTFLCWYKVLQFICLYCNFADVEMNEDKNEGSENEDCEELEKATQNVHVNVSYCILSSYLLELTLQFLESWVCWKLRSQTNQLRPVWNVWHCRCCIKFKEVSCL